MRAQIEEIVQISEAVMATGHQIPDLGQVLQVAGPVELSPDLGRQLRPGAGVAALADGAPARPVQVSDLAPGHELAELAHRHDLRNAPPSGASMSRGLQTLDRIVSRLQSLDLAAVRPSTADVAWAPAVPSGHTAFSWTGTSAPGAAGTAPPPATDSATDTNGADASPPSASGPDPVLLAQFGQLEFRVGTIVAVKRHPDADSLYIEQIDVGEASPREIVSGLVKFVPEERMLGARVIVFANLKPSKLRGITSNGMVMCASDADRTTVEFVAPPVSAAPGDRIGLEGVPLPDAFPEVNPKKKGNPWMECAPFLKTDQDRVARFRGIALVSGAGDFCKAATLKQATIS